MIVRTAVEHSTMTRRGLFRTVAAGTVGAFADLCGSSRPGWAASDENNVSTPAFHSRHIPEPWLNFDTPVGSIRQGDWKLLEFFEDGRLELYNLADDVSEEHELSASQPNAAHRLRSQLRAWRRRVDAPMPTPNPNWKR